VSFTQRHGTHTPQTTAAVIFSSREGVVKAVRCGLSLHDIVLHKPQTYGKRN